jgi:hypothetical protein
VFDPLSGAAITDLRPAGIPSAGEGCPKKDENLIFLK